MRNYIKKTKKFKCELCKDKQVIEILNPKGLAELYLPCKCNKTTLE